MVASRRLEKAGYVKPWWAARNPVGFVKKADGKWVAVYDAGSLARAVGRTVEWFREQERQGTLPKAPQFRYPKSTDPTWTRRLYTEEAIWAASRLAEASGVCDGHHVTESFMASLRGILRRYEIRPRDSATV